MHTVHLGIETISIQYINNMDNITMREVQTSCGNHDMAFTAGKALDKTNRNKHLLKIK
jgi:hypothetical protein